LNDESRSNGDSNGQRENAFDLDPGSHYDDSIEPDGEAAGVVRPRTEQERAEHIADVFARLDKADDEGFSSNELYTIDPKGEIWSSDRTLLHQSLLDKIYSRAADVPCDHEAIIAGGLSGAGKTTVLANHPEIDRSKYLAINPDNLKEEMARCGMIPEVEGLSPMEASELVHEESSYLARQLAIRAQADGKNLIWDITMSDQTKTEQRITDLREAGYTKVDALFVQIPIETSLRRTESRYWEDQDKWFSGEGFGGRLIPPEVILRQADEEWGSGNRKT
jgi:predicted ABC-type ATPase